MLNYNQAWTIYVLIEISLEFVPKQAKGPIDNKLALVQVMGWHQLGSNPLPEPIMTQFTDTYLTPGYNELRKLPILLPIHKNKLINNSWLVLSLLHIPRYGFLDYV